MTTGRYSTFHITAGALVVGSAILLVSAFPRTRRLWRQRVVQEIPKDQVLKRRQRYMSSSLSISYQNTEPLMIMRSKGSYLIDECGIRYLDTRNNVAHIGHAHPAVIRAVQEQVAAVNTNTRYLHPTMVILAERLVHLLPDPLQIVFFCNSGSEANDLALRLAKAYADGSEATVVVDRAYHGHTGNCLQVSPYKYEKGTEKVRTDDVIKVPCPDVYRGIHRDIKIAGSQYAQYVKQACDSIQANGKKARAFIVEGGMSVAGVILPPPGYLQQCAAAIREAGGLYIADEVQTGLGRLGSCQWAFQFNDPTVCPDIVTLGKPFGNGMPLAAVVTTRPVAAAFEACGIEYFNTFGGNPVCAAAGLAVLDTLRNEHLQQHAYKTGQYFRRTFLELQTKIPLIGDVRGSGLFWGVELVRDPLTLEPATEETSFICSQLKSVHRILTSVDGPHDNVIVIKPPMTFGFLEVDYLANCFERVVSGSLRQLGDDVRRMSHTPT